MKRPTRTKGRSCVGKRRWSSKARAERHRDRLIRLGAVRLAVYQCPHCDGWHVGHQPKPRT